VFTALFAATPPLCVLLSGRAPGVLLQLQLFLPGALGLDAVVPATLTIGTVTGERAIPGAPAWFPVAVRPVAPVAVPDRPLFWQVTLTEPVIMAFYGAIVLSPQPIRSVVIGSRHDISLEVPRTMRGLNLYASLSCSSLLFLFEDLVKARPYLPHYRQTLSTKQESSGSHHVYVHAVATVNVDYQAILDLQVVAIEHSFLLFAA